MKAIDALVLAGANVGRSRMEGWNWGNLDANHPNETDEAGGGPGRMGSGKRDAGKSGKLLRLYLLKELAMVTLVRLGKASCVQGHQPLGDTPDLGGS